jgi:hypothetical protein
MVPPLNHPAVRPCPANNGSHVPLAAKVGYREQVAFPGAGGDKGKEAGKLSHRTPDRKHAVLPELYPVDCIGSDRIKIVMRQVDDMGGARGNGMAKTGVIHTGGGAWHLVNTGMAGHK